MTACGAFNLEPSAVVLTVRELDPVVKCALEDLGHRVNHANNLAGALDQAGAWPPSYQRNLMIQELHHRQERLERKMGGRAQPIAEP